MIIRRIEKRAKGRFGKYIMIQSIFFIYLSSMVILGSTYNSPEINQDTIEATSLLKENGITDINSTLKTHVDISPEIILGVLYVMMIPSELSFTIYHVMNNMSNGYILAFFTLFLIDEIEVLIIALLFKYKIKL